jgi:adenosylcobyric acid synthase
MYQRKGMEYNPEHVTDLKTHKEKEYNKLADCLRASLNMKKIYEILEAGIM